MKEKLYTTDAYGRSADGRRPELDLEDPIDLGKAQKSYARYFAGYTEYRTLDGKTKKWKTVREYTGSLYHQELAGNQVRFVRVRFIAVSAAAAAGHFTAMILPTFSNRSWYAVLLALIPVVFYTKLLLSAGLYFSSGQDMKIREYRDVVLALPRTVMLLLCTLGFALAATMFLLILTPEARSALELVRILLLAASGISVLLLKNAEARISYTVKPGRNQPKKAGVTFEEEWVAAVNPQAEK